VATAIPIVIDERGTAAITAGRGIEEHLEPLEQ
jgi:hypothetical protein